MSRDLPPAQPEEPDDADEATPPGGLRPVSPTALTAWLVVGLVVGWSLRRVAPLVGHTLAPVSWTQILLLVLVAAILGGTALLTGRVVERARIDLPAHQAVNRLVLARACALVGMLLAGGYLGHAISWLGVASPVAGERAGLALVAALAGASVAVAALALERACRVRSEPPRT